MATSYAFALIAFSVAVAGAGVHLVGFAGGERDREEALRLDPLRYPPLRHSWRRALPWFVVVVAVLVLPAPWVIPIAHTFGAEIRGSNCNPGIGSVVQYVDLPSGALLTYQ